MTSAISTHRGAGPRYARRPRPDRLVARRVVGTRVVYAVGPTREQARRAAGGIVTLLVLAGLLFALGTAGRADLSRECRDVMAGSDAVASITTCREVFGSRGY